MAAAATLGAGLKARVVSFPCWELFEGQDRSYQDSVFAPGVPVLSVEAGSKTGWERYSHAQIGMDSFGASGKGGQVYEHFGFTAANVCTAAQQLCAFFGDQKAPHLRAFPRFDFTQKGGH